MSHPPPVYIHENEVFWGELVPTEHVVHLYEASESFLRLLEGFVTDGLRAGEAVIVIATGSHRAALNERLRRNGFDLGAVRESRQYLDLSAENCLATFMKEGWPDEDRFNREIQNVIHRVQAPGRRIRAFGEMVALLWAKGNSGATVRLEHLWNQFRLRQPFPLFCAYPKSGFTTDTDASLQAICRAHTKVILAGEKSTSELTA